MGWCDDPRSKQYNKPIKFPFNKSAEKLYRKDNTYDIILVLISIPSENLLTILFCIIIILLNFFLNDHLRQRGYWLQ